MSFSLKWISSHEFFDLKAKLSRILEKGFLSSHGHFYFDGFFTDRIENSFGDEVWLETAKCFSIGVADIVTDLRSNSGKLANFWHNG